MLRSVVNENFIDIPKVYVPAYSDGPPQKNQMIDFLQTSQIY